MRLLSTLAVLLSRLMVAFSLFFVVLLAGLAAWLLVERYWLTPTEYQLHRFLNGGNPAGHLAADDLLWWGEADAGWEWVCVRGPYAYLFDLGAMQAPSTPDGTSARDVIGRINAHLERHDPVVSESEWQVIYGSRTDVKVMTIDDHQVRIAPPRVACVPYEKARFSRATFQDRPSVTGLRLDRG